MWVWSVGREDPLEEGLATHSSILVWRIPMDRGAWQATAQSVANSQIWLKRLSMQHALHIETLCRLVSVLDKDVQGRSMRYLPILSGSECTEILARSWGSQKLEKYRKPKPAVNREIVGEGQSDTESWNAPWRLHQKNCYLWQNICPSPDIQLSISYRLLVNSYMPKAVLLRPCPFDRIFILKATMW